MYGARNVGLDIRLNFSYNTYSDEVGFLLCISMQIGSTDEKD